MADEFDVVLVGFGFQGMTLLAREPSLLETRLAIIEQDHDLSGGSMNRFSVFANSFASTLLKPFAQSDALLPLLTKSETAKKLMSLHKPVACHDIGIVLSEIARTIVHAYPGIQFFRGKSVRSIAAFQTCLEFDLSAGLKVVGRAGVLATGRRELLRPQLRQYGNIAMTSGDFLSGGALRLEGQAARVQRIAILGGGHSAFSVLERAWEAVRQAGHEVDVFHRSPVALYYPSAAEAQAADRTPGERPFEIPRHLCPETGAVFRDSGLRGRSAEIFRHIAHDRTAPVRLVRVGDASDIEDRLGSYDLIVQATGWVPNLPRLEYRGKTVWTGDGTDEPLTSEGETRVWAEVENHIESLPLFLVRLIRTPPERRDNDPAAHDVYPAIARMAGAGADSVRHSERAH